MIFIPHDVSGSSNIGVIENSIFGMIINFHSHIVIDGVNSFDEHSDNFVQNGVFFLSSGFFLSVEGSNGV